MKKQYIVFALIFALTGATQSMVAMAPPPVGLAPQYGTLSSIKHESLKSLSALYKAGCGALAVPKHAIKAVSSTLYMPVNILSSLWSHKKLATGITGVSLVAYLGYLLSICPISAAGILSSDYLNAIIQLIQDHCGDVCQFAQNHSSKLVFTSLTVVINALLANMKKKKVAVPVVLTTIIGLVVMWNNAPDGFLSHPYIQSILNGSVALASNAAEQTALFLEHCPEYAGALRQFIQQNVNPSFEIPVVPTSFEQAQRLVEGFNCTQVVELIKPLSNCTQAITDAVCPVVSEAAGATCDCSLAEIQQVIGNLNCTQVIEAVDPLNCTQTVANAICSAAEQAREAVLNAQPPVDIPAANTTDANIMWKLITGFKLF